MNLLARWAQRGVTRAETALGLAQRLLGELPLAFHGPTAERAMLDETYAELRHYRSPENQRLGLIPLEERALAAHFPAPPAKLLLHGAGAGRELLALLDRGYEVDAFEPVQVFVDAANEQLASREKGVVRSSTLQAWASAPIGRYAGVITGWGVWSHLLRQEDRIAALRAFRVVCPSGPVLLSFWRMEPAFDHRERETLAPPLHPPPQGKLQALTRGLLRQRLLRQPPLERGTVWNRGMYLHRVSAAELREEASLTGYELVHYEQDGSRYPNAILRPLAGP